MKTHYSEADLLETYYTAPGESMPVMMHLAQCGECAARYERLDRKLREAAACAPKPESFWTRQRQTILHTIEARRSGAITFAPAVRFAAAAVVTFLVGAGVLVMRNEPVQPDPVQVQAQAQAQMPAQQLDQRVPADPWESEALDDFGAVVQWESWLDEDQKKEQSL